MKAFKTYKRYLKMVPYNKLTEAINEKKYFSARVLADELGGGRSDYCSIRSYINLLIKKGYIEFSEVKIHKTLAGYRAINYYTLIKPIESVLRKNIISHPSVITGTMGGMTGVICSVEGKVILSFDKHIIAKNAKVFHSKYNAEGYMMRVKSIIGKGYKFKIQGHGEITNTEARGN